MRMLRPNWISWCSTESTRWTTWHSQGLWRKDKALDQESTPGRLQANLAVGTLNRIEEQNTGRRRRGKDFPKYMQERCIGSENQHGGDCRVLVQTALKHKTLKRRQFSSLAKQCLIHYDFLPFTNICFITFPSRLLHQKGNHHSERQQGLQKRVWQDIASLPAPKSLSSAQAPLSTCLSYDFSQARY